MGQLCDLGDGLDPVRVVVWMSGGSCDIWGGRLFVLHIGYA